MKKQFFYLKNYMLYKKIIEPKEISKKSFVKFKELVENKRRIENN